MKHTRWMTAALCCAGTLAFASPVSAQIARLGAVGDSLTDEYSEETYSYARNWTMQLVQFRGFDMGATAAGQPGNTWGEPRRTGYRYNWARYGADSTTAISSGQHTGLAAQLGTAASGGVTHAVVAIGANDFSPQSSAYLNLYFNFWSAATVDAYVNGRIANVRAIVETLDTPAAGLMLCNYVDFGVVPASRQVWGNANNRNRVTAVIARVNEGVEQIAREHRLVLIDLNRLGTNIIGTNTALKQFLTIGNVNIQLFNRDTAAHGNPLAGFVDDGAHPHTTLQGVFANVMMTAMNTGWQAGNSMFSDAEILGIAGIGYGGSDTLAAQVGPYSQYVRSYRCPADFTGDGIINTNDLLVLLGVFGGTVAPGTGGDMNADGLVNTLDLAAFIGVFGEECP